MMPLATPWRTVAAAVLLVVSGFAGGYALKGRIDAAKVERLRGDIASLEARHAAEKQAAAEEAARRLAAAQAAERDAVRSLRATRVRLETTTKRLKEALYGLPTAHRCGLSLGAVGLLDRAIRDGGDVSAGAGEPAGADAASAADAARPAASEAAVGGWIADAIALYGECRARIDAIRQWDVATYGR